MTDSEHWHEQLGGLHLAVVSFNRNNPDHREAVANVMHASIQTIAQVHGASFSERGFRNNMRALYRSDLDVDLYLAKWEICQPKSKPIYLGAAIKWKTAGFDEFGNIHGGIYDEDICILKPQLRQLIRQKPRDKEFPKRSLAECFDQIKLQDLLQQDDLWYRFGEVDPDNTTMMRSLLNGEATIGTPQDSGVLEFKCFPNNLLDSFPMDVEVMDMGRASTPNVFATRLSDGIIDIRFAATKGQATAAGKPRLDMRPWHNGKLPENPIILNAALASSLNAIQNKLLDDKWGEVNEASLQSPIIPLRALRPEVLRVLCTSCASDLVASPETRPSTFIPPMPEAHVFVIKDQPMLDGLKRLGAKNRTFGGKLMMPGVNKIRAQDLVL
ncbi:MAG: hypothetical protein EOM37_01270 [Proteobacteria bacterium]|jgi:hypothetical protein|nr:hypothetical protein [Pseudomonadota bacterium]